MRGQTEVKQMDKTMEETKNIAIAFKNYFTPGRIMLWTLFMRKYEESFIFTGPESQNYFFYQRNSVRFAYRSSVYDATDSAVTRPFGRCHLHYLVYSKYCTSLRWSFRGKFLYCLANKLLMAYKTSSRHINTIVCTCYALVQRESFYICQDLWNRRDHILFRSPWQPHKVHSACKALTNLRFDFSSYLKQGACSLLVFVHLWWVFCR